MVYIIQVCFLQLSELPCLCKPWDCVVEQQRGLESEVTRNHCIKEVWRQGEQQLGYKWGEGGTDLWSLMYTAASFSGITYNIFFFFFLTSALEYLSLVLFMSLQCASLEASPSSLSSVAKVFTTPQYIWWPITKSCFFFFIFQKFCAAYKHNRMNYHMIHARVPPDVSRHYTETQSFASTSTPSANFCKSAFQNFKPVLSKVWSLRCL